MGWYCTRLVDIRHLNGATKQMRLAACVMLSRTKLAVVTHHSGSQARRSHSSENGTKQPPLERINQRHDVSSLMVNSSHALHSHISSELLRSFFEATGCGGYAR